MGDKGGQHDEGEKQVEVWKIKRLIKGLEAARGNGTSMISLIMPPKDQVARVQKMLGDELGTASNIKSRVNRQSVLGAITSAQQRLKLYTKVPPNGLVIYTGTIVTDDGKEKKLNIDFEPFKPINTSLYLCDNKFHTEALNELLESDQKYGFIVMDGNGSLFGTLSGNTREVLHKFTVDLPKKHGRGGQSALRFARLRLEKRHNYVRKVAETATQFFISGDRPNVAGLVLAGSADFKNELSTSDMFDPRLSAVVLSVVDVSYDQMAVSQYQEPAFAVAVPQQWRTRFIAGIFLLASFACLALVAKQAVSEQRRKRPRTALERTLLEQKLWRWYYSRGENGFNQAIELSADTLANVKFVQEKRLISKFFDEISQDTGKFVFGVKDTLSCLEMGAVEVLIVWESLDINHYELMNSSTGEMVVKNLSSQQETDASHFRDKETGAELEVQEKLPLLEWLANNYKKFGCQLEFVTNKSQEGSQFCRGFGGIGGLLRYAVDLAEFEPDEDDLDDREWDSSDEDI